MIRVIRNMRFTWMDVLAFLSAGVGIGIFLGAYVL